MQDAVWEDVAPYVVHARQSHEQGEARAERIAKFLRSELNSEHLEILLRGMHAPGTNNGSCSQFFIYLDESWSPLPADRFAVRQRYTLHLAVSERGPFILSSGSEWLPSRFEWEDPATPLERLHPFPCAGAAARAKALALAVGRRFELTYLEADWLRQFKLSKKELPEDVLCSLDYSEPDALNVLFDESL